ncbi:MAG: hypothetical protein GY811_25085 [Myxococcales bacterium]|nr:hypothetical protein [Myxococcales bacterium]
MKLSTNLLTTTLLSTAIWLPSAVADDASPTPPAEESTEEAPADEEEVSGWFRIDTDALGTQFWVGATHTVGGVSIASDIYVVGTFAEFDIGPAFSFGDLAVTPMVGLGVDYGTSEVTSLIAPQLFTVYSNDSIYLESWIQGFFNTPFADDAVDSLYTRNFLLYAATENLSLGPQAELTYQITDDDMTGSGVVGIPVGVRVNLGYGANNTLGIFLGYDSKASGDGVAGRFTFVRSW